MLLPRLVHRRQAAEQDDERERRRERDRPDRGARVLHGNTVGQDGIHGATMTAHGRECKGSSRS